MVYRDNFLKHHLNRNLPIVISTHYNQRTPGELARWIASGQRHPLHDDRSHRSFRSGRAGPTVPLGEEPEAEERPDRMGETKTGGVEERASI